MAIGGERVKKADGKERREVALAPLPALGAAGHAMGVLTRLLAFGPTGAGIVQAATRQGCIKARRMDFR